MRFHITAEFDLEVKDWAAARELADAYFLEQGRRMQVNVAGTEDVPADEHAARAQNTNVAGTLASWVLAAGAVTRPDVVELYDGHISVRDNG
ncbi:hypothetical protein [Blastococcus sp. CT_GayMR16]|uniref:hypothetical protein n=1 Tax=Blastococcus sp. CT_GayMR16 TaxID=2559607 RepID=UPI0010741A71|nr:hypothetical protein [Blastococcus sp. CT_GayMR16]TFV89812.1 hypothetical protein E4P38_04940 [Blastococcus sp. CT_GayMR16]